MSGRNQKARYQTGFKLSTTGVNIPEVGRYLIKLVLTHGTSADQF